jgi:hypothetical protein
VIPGLLAWYKGELDANDEQAQSNAAWVGGSPVYTDAGFVGAAFDLTTLANTGVLLANVNSQDFNLLDGGTLEGWVFLNASNASGRIIDRITAGGSDGYLLDVFPGPRLRVIAGFRSYVSTQNIPVNEWVHVAGTWSGSGIQPVYVNGAPVASTVFGSSGGLSQYYPSTVGRSAQGGSIERLNARIDEISVHGRTLTSAEIAAIYARGRLGRCR